MAFPKTCAGWTLEKTQEFPEYALTALYYVHDKHKCPFLVLHAAEDNHNVFSVAFKTVPTDDSGSCHMLEHLTLEGSTKYPINDLFTELSKRSYATFMNAMTSAQWTMYPFSSTNESDFRNNMDCYLDAAFRPRLLEESFEKECYHLEFEDNDPEKPLIHAGVVYNEMCGAFNTPLEYVSRQVNSALYPDSAMRFTSGGYPDAIVSMTVDGIREKHKQYYHPNNAYFYVYGSFDFEKTLSAVSALIDPMDIAPRMDVTSLVQQLPWTDPRKISCEFPKDGMADGDTAKCRAVVSWLCPDITDDSLMTDLLILDKLMNDSNNSVTYKTFIKTGLAKMTSMASFTQECYTSNFSIGVEGMSDENVDKFEDMVLESIEKVVAEGFGAERVESVLKNLELEERMTSAHTGRNMLLMITDGWIHGVDPLELLNWKAEFTRLKSEIAANPRKFEDLAKKYLLDNKSRLFYVGRPKDGLLDAWNDKVKSSLVARKSDMSDSDKNDLIARTQRMLDFGNAAPPVELLPVMSRSMLSVDEKLVKPTWEEGDIAIFKQPVKEMTHVHVRIDVTKNHPLIGHLGTLGYLMPLLGAGDLNDEEMSMFLKKWTGGMTILPTVEVSKDSVDTFKLIVTVKVSCLDADFDHMMNAIKLILTATKFDPEVIKRRILTKYSTIRAQLGQRGLQFADSMAKAGVSDAYATTELLSGFTMVTGLKNLVECNNFESVARDLEQLCNDVIRTGYMKIAAHVSTDDQKDKILSALSSFVTTFNSCTSVDDTPSPVIVSLREHFQLKPKLFLQADTATNFCVKIVPTLNVSDPIAHGLDCLSELISNGKLYEKIRVGLGAYGAWSMYNRTRGIISFVSYRDRNVQGCLDAFESTMTEIANGDVNDKDVDQVVIKLFSQLDQPLAPQNIGIKQWSSGDSDDFILDWRRRVYGLTRSDVVQAADHVKERSKDARYAVFSSKAIAESPAGFEVTNIE